MGQTRVDLLHLLEDLRDAYPGSLEETIVGETVANALDSGATNIAFDADPAAASLAIVDDGEGMTRAQLRRYHDLAATSKRRGRGIGFAGVGIKLALLACDKVVTESRRAGRTAATSWRLASRQRAPWEWIAPIGLVQGPSGTAVRLRLANPLAPLLDPGWLVATLLRQFAPLFDPGFDDILANAYARGIVFHVNGREVPRAPLAHVRILGDARLLDRSDVAARLPRKRKPSALGWLARFDAPLPDLERGVAIATLGKVIKRGWDWIGVTPAAADRITGLIEAPGLAEALTLNKADFIRAGQRGATYLAYRKIVQEAAGAQLAEWGDEPKPPPARRPRTRRIERDLEHVLVDLADDFPLLGALVERRRGGQRRIAFGHAAKPGEDWAPGGGVRTDSTPAPAADAEPAVSPPPHTQDHARPSPTDADAEASPQPRAEPTDTGLPGRAGRKKPGRYGLDVQFESREGESQLARLIESTVWVNDAHPAWHRALAARSEGYHIALSVAMALAPLAAEPTDVHGFITAFLERWGEAAGNGGKPRGKR